jgi:putative cell wall-binding protein
MSSSSLSRVLRTMLALVVLASMVTGAYATTATIESPDAAYLASTTKIDISGITDFTEVQQIADHALAVWFDPPVQKRTVGSSWATWSSPPFSEEAQPHILRAPSSNLTMELSRPVSVLGIELEGDAFTDNSFTVTFKLSAEDEAVASITQTVNGNAGARLFALKSPDNLSQFNKIEITTSDFAFALGQVRYAFVAPGVIDVQGNNRYETAIAGSKAAFQDGAPAVVIATGASFADALGGAALAGALKSPLLLTPRATLPDAVRAEIVRLKAKDVYILGGSAAVSTAVQNSLTVIPGVTSVTRIAGANRYQTAEQVAAATIDVLGMEYEGDAFVATGANFPDALGASPIAAARRMPIYLANPASSSVSLPSQVERVWISGGEAAVPIAIEASLKTKLGFGNVTRLAGSNRFHTAAMLASFGETRGMSWNGVGIATGRNFPDALAAGPVLGARNTVLLLTDSTSVPSQTQSALSAKKDEIFAVHFFGGSAAVPPAVRTTVLNLVN